MSRFVFAAGVLAAALVVTAAGCGGGGGGDSGHVCQGANTTPDPTLLEDFAPHFTGTWIGNLTVSAPAYALSETDPASLRVTSSARNKLNLVDVCGNGVPALASFFAVASAPKPEPTTTTCPPISVQGCSSVVLTLNSGGGTVDGLGNLTVNLYGTARGCGLEFEMDLEFEASRVGALVESAPEDDAAVTAVQQVASRISW